MSDPEKVRSETQMEVVEITRPGIVIGWTPNGNFAWITMNGVTNEQANALLDLVKGAILTRVNPTRDPESKIALVPGMPAALTGKGR